MNSMHFYTIVFFLCMCLLSVHCNGWWMWGKKGSSSSCPRREAAQPYYFGNTQIDCLLSFLIRHRGKRSAPWRGRWDLVHRFIYYRGKYFEFFDDSSVNIGNGRVGGHRCGGGIEGSPAGYSELSLECIERCTNRYTASFGGYNLLLNNCNSFVNRLSEVLCRRGTQCPSWCG
ncbi:uncharacterized protein LOC134267558 [Saccostrea cucullata]|uniref:uncharacterized protein LOC134267558 n=1 Tax=Saccostrea cuccullata TaxID=36930 RepID=UPI002ED55859